MVSHADESQPKNIFCLGAEAPRHSAGYVYVCPRPRAIQLERMRDGFTN